MDEEPAILSQIQAGKRVEHFETKRRRKNGSLIDISLTISPIRNEKGVIIGASKIARDITERKLAQEQQQLLIGEMRHRVKNLFALANAIVSISARSSQPGENVIEKIQARLASLARAHELTLSSAEAELQQDLLVGLLSLIHTILDPYIIDDRIRVEGADPKAGGQAVTSLSLLLHELATNAAKYGALSVPSGRLDVSVDESEDQVRLIWRESGGPEPSVNVTAGFGSRLENALANALNATIQRDWEITGLIVSIVVPKAKLQA